MGSMAIKKSDICRSLWESCDQLRGSMDAWLYKDCILTLLLVKYVSDRADQPDALIVVPPDASFTDMKHLWGSRDISKRIGLLNARQRPFPNLYRAIDEEVKCKVRPTAVGNGKRTGPASASSGSALPARPRGGES